MTAKIFRFGDFELDRSAYQLRRAGTDVHLQRIPFQLLCLLVERRGELVTREEILEHIWGKGVFVDVENSINTAVRKIRQVLNDDANAPRFVITVPSRGYRFDAVTCVASATPSQLRLSRGAFIGRDREMAKLRAGLANIALGHQGLFMISGEPGIGKSRLTEELMALAEANRIGVLVGRCVDQEESASYLPFVEILEACVDRTNSPEDLTRLIGKEGTELALLLPKLRRILPDLPKPRELSPRETRRQLFSSFCDFVIRVAREKPTLLILEDLHWADDLR